MTSCPIRRDAVIQRDAVGPDRGMQPLVPVTSATRKGDDRDMRILSLERRRDFARGLYCVFGEILALQRSGPAVEKLDDFCPGVDLARQIVDRACSDLGKQRFEHGAVFVFQRVRRALVRGALACDHIGRDGPRGASETDQRGIRRQFTRQDLDGFIDGRQHGVDLVHGAEFIQTGLIGDRGQTRAFARDEPQVRTQRLRQQ